MSKKLIIICVFTSMLMLTGCSSIKIEESEVSAKESEALAKESEALAKESELLEKNLKVIEKLTTSQSDISSYTNEGDIVFVPLQHQHIKDGTTNGLDFIQYVYVENKTIWTYVENGGDGISFQQMFDENGKPLMFEGDVDGLIEDLARCGKGINYGNVNSNLW